MSGGGTNTTTTVSGPPPEFLAGYQDVLGKAQNQAQTPYQPYPGNIVAPLSPSQNAGIAATQNAVGTAVPYINAAAQYINNATQPLWPSVQQFSPSAVQQYESPYTSDVVNATRNLFNEQNAQQQQGVIGNAISRGAWGGDRSAVAQGILAGQQQLAEAPTLANLENQGYAQALQEFNQQQGAQLGANQANAWLNSQAGFGMGNLGNEALSTSLTGANALLGVGNLEQGQAQAELNVPFQQYTAAQAYPFQTLGWLANIAEGLGGAAGGSSATTAPGPSVGSQIAGAGLAGAGILGQTGAFGSNGWLTGAGGLFGGGGAGADWTGAGGLGLTNVYGNRGGEVHARAPGGIIPIPTGVPDVSVSVVPGAMGLGDPSMHHGQNFLNTSTGSTTTSSSDPGIMGILGPIATIAKIGSMFFEDGGELPEHRGIVVPFPHHRTRMGRGIMAANDEGPQQRRAAGGITVPTVVSPLVSTVPGSYAGSPLVPVLSTPDISVATSGGTGGTGITPVSDYLAAVRAGEFHGAPPAPPPMPTKASSTGAAGTTPIFGTNTLRPGDVGFENPFTGEGGGDSGGDTGGEGIARGGAVHRDDGGALDDAWDLPADSGTADTGDAWDLPTGSQPGAAAAMIAPPSAGIVSGQARPQAAPSGGGNDLWRTLTYAGLGIMGGTSPHAAVNIGRGALAGLKQSEDARLREEMAKYRASNLNSLSAYRQGTLDTRERGQDLRHQDAQANMENRLAIAAGRAARNGLSGAQLQASLIDSLTHPTDGSDPMPLPQAIEAAKGWVGRGAVSQERADTQRSQGQARIDQGNERIAIAKGNLVMRQEDIAQRAQARANAAEDNAAKAIMGNAALAGKKVPSYEQALGMVRSGREKSGAAPVPAGNNAADPLGLNSQ